jgi:putative ABC transport system permease protein
VANLVLVRAASRQREFAIRAALGAGRRRLMRQTLAEAAVISAPGTLAGVVLAWLGVRGLPAIAPANVPRLDAVAIDWRVLAFAAVAGAAATVMLGAAAAFARNRAEALRVGGTAAVPRRVPALRNAVVVAQVALSFVLLAGSGLMLRSFLALRRVDPGFDARRTLTFLLIGEPRGFPPQRRLPLLREIQARMRAIPGVEDASASAFFPLKRGFAVSVGWGTEKNPEPDNSRAAAADYVLPGYFETLRTPVIEGRTFSEEDNAPGRKVAVIDRTLAHKAFGKESAVGKRILVQLAKREWFEVIGVVAHQRRASLAEPGPEQIYFTDGAMGVGISRHWALRTAGDPAACAKAVRAEMARLAPGLLAVTEVQPLDALVERARAGLRFELLIIGAIAAIAAALAAVGLYGVLASAVRQRTAEIGVRMALGAAPVAIFRLIAGQGLRLTATGIALGAGGALWLTRWMKSILVGVQPGDLPTYTAMAAVFLAIAALSCWLPARRAAALDPAAALRQD